MIRYEGDGIRTVWFDLDDTLMDFKANSRASLELVYETIPEVNSLFGSAEEWICRYETHNHRLWDAYSRAEIDAARLRMDRFRLPFTDAGMDWEGAGRLSSRLDTLYLDLLAGQCRLVEGAVDILKWLKMCGDVNIGVLSNGFAEVQHRKIHNSGLDGYIDITVLSDDIGVNKPDRRLFDYAAEKAGTDCPGSNILIGDNLSTDIAGALGAGWHAIWFAPGVEPSGRAGAPCQTVATLAEAREKLASTSETGPNKVLK